MPKNVWKINKTMRNSWVSFLLSFVYFWNIFWNVYFWNKRHALLHHQHSLAWADSPSWSVICDLRSGIGGSRIGDGGSCGRKQKHPSNINASSDAATSAPICGKKQKIKQLGHQFMNSQARPFPFVGILNAECHWSWMFWHSWLASALFGHLQSVFFFQN